MGRDRGLGAVRTGRLLLLVPGGVALLAGLDAALLLLGVAAPVRDASLADMHGVLMILGFVGTVVALERAVALGRYWGFASPAALGAGTIVLLTPAPRDSGATLLLIGTAILGIVYIPLWRRNAQPAVLVQAAGAIMAIGGSTLWAGGAGMPRALPWFVAFLVVTIAGERLELAHVGLSDPRAEPSALAVTGAVIVGAVAALLWPEVGYPLLALSLLALVAWLLRYDVARRTVRATGLPRFSAICLLTGYAWLTVAASVWLIAGPTLAGPLYDASTHAVLLGFVISMIMAHAPIILPAVLRRGLPYHPVMYAPAVLLHISLAVRLIGGDARGSDTALQVGGIGNIVALLGFIVVAVGSALAAGFRQRHAAPASTGPTNAAVSTTAPAPADSAAPADSGASTHSGDSDAPTSGARSPLRGPSPLGGSTQDRSTQGRSVRGGPHPR